MGDLEGMYEFWGVECSACRGHVTKGASVCSKCGADLSFSQDRWLFRLANPEGPPRPAEMAGATAGAGQAESAGAG